MANTASSNAPLSNLDTNIAAPAQVSFVNPTKPGQLSSIKTQTGFVLDPESNKEITANMERLLAERTSPYQKAQAGLDTMLAHTGYLPTERIATNKATQEASQAETYNIAQQLAQLKAAQRIAGRDMTSLLNLVTGSQGKAAAGDPDAIAFNNLDASNRALFTEALGRGDTNLARDILAKFAVRESNARLQNLYNIEGGAPVTVNVRWKDGKTYPVTMGKRDATTYSQTGKLPPDLQKDWDRDASPVQKAAGGSINNNIKHYEEGKTVQAEEPSTAKKLLEDLATILSGSSTAEAAPPPPVGTTPPSKGFGVQVFPVDSSTAVLPKTPVSTGPALTSIASRSGPPIPITQAQSEAESALRRGEQSNQANLEATKKAREEAGTYISKITEQALKNDQVQRAASAIINHARQHPEDFAYHMQSDVPGYVTGLTHDLPYVGPAVENYVAKIKGGDEAVNRRAATDSNSLKLGIEYAKQELTGSGIRPGAELFRRGAEAKGVGINMPAESNIYNAFLIGSEYGKSADQAKAWNTYKTAEEKAGRVPDPHVFLMSPTNVAIEEKWKKFLNDNLPFQGLPEKDGRKPLENFYKTPKK